MHTRATRVAERVREEVSDIIQRHMKDPGVGFASVVSVDVSNDLRHARIYVSVFGEPAQQQATMAALERAKGFIRSELGQRLQLFRTPELVFSLDDSLAHGDRIHRLLTEMKRQEQEGEGKGSV